MKYERLTDEKFIKAVETCNMACVCGENCIECVYFNADDCAESIQGKLKKAIPRLAELEDKIEQGTLIEFPRVVERKIPIYDEGCIHFDKSTTVWDVEEMKPNGCVITRFLYESSAYQRLEEIKNGN